ncbi:MAG: hypothetical protein FJ405_10235, partial [Verrucomicrobia bacterium]|nr:hypothetical protein [Verrucomicrobiota bacterium]
KDGRATTYSEPGACVLVAAPGGSQEESGLFTTDLIGSDGANIFGFFPPFQYLSDYMFNSIGFIGTSAAAPLVSGIAGILLQVNPALTARDVQQILLLSAQPFDLGDPDLTRNGAGLLTGHNTGFGVVDAGEAARLAQRWVNRPVLEIHSLPPQEIARSIPDDGLKLLISGDDVPSELASMRTLPGTGPFADEPMVGVPLRTVTDPANLASGSLVNFGALLEYNSSRVVEQLRQVGAAGASFAVVYNCAAPSGAPCSLSVGLPLNGTDYTPIPAVFIGRTNGLNLVELFRTNTTAQARLQLTTADYSFGVTNQLSLEHVRVRLKTDHPLRGDLRITLRSPSGTRSVLQRLNDDTAPGPVDWIYMSTRHFFEASEGEWTVSISDLAEGQTGSVTYCELILHGVSITDTDRDGLDDQWEVANMGGLQKGAADRVQEDAYSLVRKFVAGMDPKVPAHAFRLELVEWKSDVARLSWPRGLGVEELWSGADPALMSPGSTVESGTWESVAFVPLTDRARFFQVRRVP